MAELAVGFAKSVVEGTLSKAQAAIEQEGKLRRSAQRDLVFITGEFQMMQSFLKVANAERVENPVVMTWVRQIRDLAYDVEDCIEFVVHLDEKRGWWWRMVPSWTSWCLGPVAMPLDEAVDEIEHLKARVEDVSTRNTRYSLISDTGSKPVAAVQEQQPGASARRAEAALNMAMGAAGRRQQGDLAQLLAVKQDDQLLLRVISVWGSTSGDLGATSIIWKAYNDQQICQNFPRRAWMKLTHPFNPHEFVASLKDQFHANASQEHHQVNNIGLDVLRRRTSESEATQGDSLKAVEQQLDDDRYLVVLEDLSTLTDWDSIRKFFPPRKNRSCIIVSTQQSQVASLCVGHPYQILDLNQYSVDHSVYAFYKEGPPSLGDKGKVAADTVVSSTLKKRATEDWMAKNPLVARASEMYELSQNIIKALSKSIQVISVWGIASVGKSTLVKSVFCNRILSDCKQLQRKRGSLFDKYGWVDIPHPFNLTDFSRSLLLNFGSESLDAKEIAHRGMSSNNPIVECQSILKNKRCFVVIDNLQSTKEWDLIQAQLVSGFTNNCIIAITSEASLARHCRGDKGEILFNVKSLGSDSSYQLFRNKVSATNHRLHSSFFDENAVDLQELVSKCGGLPEVIVEIASSLGNKSVKRMDYARFLSNNFMHDLERNREFDSLQGLFGWIRTYFRTCPDSLKPCIFYLSIFPRGCNIRRRRLVRRWIAEGYSRDSHEESAELIGEKQFSDLLDLSIFQQPPTALGDIRTVSCQVSGFIREYILSRRMEDNLVFELGGTTCTLTTQRSGRHLVILEDWHRDRIMFHNIDFSRLRSLTVFGNWESFFVSRSMKRLRVLDLENASDIKYEDLENMVKWMCRLKFLSLRGRHEIHHLPRSLHHLRQLQTLDVRDTSIVTLPKSITKLEKLQYIRVGTTNTPASTPHASRSWFCKRGHLIGAEVPIGVGRLTALHTLGVANISVSGEKSMVKELKKLTQLRKLGVSGISKYNSVKFFDAIKVLVHLESLSVQLDKGNQISSDVIKLPMEKLRSLKLYGLNDKLPECISGLSKLAKLDLEMVTSMPEKSIKLLGELPQLCILRVKQQQGGELNFYVSDNSEEVDSYQEVKVLEVTCSFNTLCVKFGSQTMKKLELLKIDCCNGSQPYQFSGLENLKGLKEVLIAKGSNAETLKKQFEEDLKEVKPVVKLV